MKFAKKWRDEEKFSIYDKLKDKVRPSGSLKPQLDNASKRMQVQIQKLDRAANHISKRDEELFSKTVDAYTKHDLVRAKVYANELVEMRKSKRQILDTKLALEQIALRIGTVSEFGDVVSMLSPTVSVLQNIGKGISNTMPEAGRELGQIGDLLTGVISESNQGSGMQIDFEGPSNDAKNILNEAAEFAEQNIKHQLPEVPTFIPKNITEIKEKEALT